MNKVLLALSLVALASPLAAAATLPGPTMAPQNVDDFLACAEYHVGLAMSTGNPVHFFAALLCTPLILR